MKKFIVFFGCCYYPKGGAKDILGFTDTIEDAKNLVVDFYQKNYNENFARFKSVDDKLSFIKNEYSLDWSHAFDTETKEIVNLLN